ncbi:hypothetical protein BpHYR1_039834 [Brachionus plicatilis]|uniref:Uncharacterized protein n=1 Tax=Brachionus plicatilis TaxID=10195 RepID=A0A3M7S8R1_BRAPC|nr:hypothetical protein BpHYR1_039834 [Brachionus plicatilis]
MNEQSNPMVVEFVDMFAKNSAMKNSSKLKKYQNKVCINHDLTEAERVIAKKLRDERNSKLEQIDQTTGLKYGTENKKKFHYVHINITELKYNEPSIVYNTVIVDSQTVDTLVVTDHINTNDNHIEFRDQFCSNLYSQPVTEQKPDETIFQNEICLIRRETSEFWLNGLNCRSKTFSWCPAELTRMFPFFQSMTIMVESWSMPHEASFSPAGSNARIPTPSVWPPFRMNVVCKVVESQTKIYGDFPTWPVAT